MAQNLRGSEPQKSFAIYRCPLLRYTEGRKRGGAVMAGRRICAGYYRRYDGKGIYVVSLATDADPGAGSGDPDPVLPEHRKVNSRRNCAA